jgi:hypothetical protein
MTGTTGDEEEESKYGGDAPTSPTSVVDEEDHEAIVDVAVEV